MQGPTYKIYIRNRQGYWLYQDEIGSIQFSEVKRAIQYTFDGWMNLIASIIRNKEYKGCFRKVATPVKFVLDGKDIIDHVAVYEGPNAYVELIIEVQKPENFDYELFFYGTLDFEEGYRYSEDFTTVNIREILIIDLIEAKKNVMYSIPLTDDNSERIQMDGTDLAYQTKYGVLDGFGADGFYNNGNHIVELVALTNENAAAYENTIRTRVPETNDTLFLGAVVATGQLFNEATVKGRMEFEWDFKINVRYTALSPAPNVNFILSYRIYKRSTAGVFTSIPVYLVTGRDNVFPTPIYNNSAGKDHNIKGKAEMDYQIGDKFYFVCVANPKGFSGGSEQMEIYYYPDPAFFTATAFQRQPATIHRAIKAWKLWQELMNKTSDGKYSGTSPYLYNDENQLLISGTSLRREDNPTIQWTIADFLKYVWVNKRGVIKDVSGNNALIAEYSDTFKPGTFTHLGEVKEFEWEFDKDALVSAIVVGYENIDFGVDGQINGKDEYNQKNHFTTAQETIDATYEIVSPAIASMYAQELMRVNFAKKGTTDNKGDNKVYLVDAEKGADILYYNGLIEFIAPDKLRIAGNYGFLTGSQITITEAGAYNGVYDVTNTSYLVVGYTTLTLSVAAFGAGVTGGVITYVDATIYKPYRPVYASITGVLSPLTCYNNRITPKDILLLHAPIIAAGVYNMNASDALDIITFQSGDKNTKLSVSLDGVRFVTQDANERFSQLAQPFTLPIIFHFKTDYDRDIFSRLIGDSRYEQIGFTQKGIELAGYNDEIHTNADTGESQAWKLKSNVSTNLINLLQWRRS